MAERWGAIEVIRARELQRVFAHRYGAQLPDDDAGRDDMRLMLSQLARVAHPVQRMSNFLDLYCPWLTRGEREMLVQEAMTTPPERRTADDIADRIGIDFRTRTQLRVTTIGATDVRKDDRKRLRAARRAERERRRRTLKRKATKANGTAAAMAGRTPAVRCALSNTTEWQSTRDVADTVAAVRFGNPRAVRGTQFMLQPCCSGMNGSLCCSLGNVGNRCGCTSIVNARIMAARQLLARWHEQARPTVHDLRARQAPSD